MIKSMNNLRTDYPCNHLWLHPRTIHTKYEANLCSGSREVKHMILHSDIYSELL